MGDKMNWLQFVVAVEVYPRLPAAACERLQLGLSSIAANSSVQVRSASGGSLSCDSLRRDVTLYPSVLLRLASAVLHRLRRRQPLYAFDMLLPLYKACLAVPCCTIAVMPLLLRAADCLRSIMREGYADEDCMMDRLVPSQQAALCAALDAMQDLADSCMAELKRGMEEEELDEDEPEEDAPAAPLHLLELAEELLPGDDEPLSALFCHLVLAHSRTMKGKRAAGAAAAISSCYRALPAGTGDSCPRSELLRLWASICMRASNLTEAAESLEAVVAAARETVGDGSDAAALAAVLRLAFARAASVSLKELHTFVADALPTCVDALREDSARDTVLPALAAAVTALGETTGRWDGALEELPKLRKHVASGHAVPLLQTAAAAAVRGLPLDVGAARAAALAAAHGAALLPAALSLCTRLLQQAVDIRDELLPAAAAVAACEDEEQAADVISLLHKLPAPSHALLATAARRMGCRLFTALQAVTDDCAGDDDLLAAALTIFASIGPMEGFADGVTLSSRAIAVKQLASRADYIASELPPAASALTERLLTRGSLDELRLWGRLARPPLHRPPFAALLAAVLRPSADVAGWCLLAEAGSMLLELGEDGVGGAIADGEQESKDSPEEAAATAAASLLAARARFAGNGQDAAWLCAVLALQVDGAECPEQLLPALPQLLQLLRQPMLYAQLRSTIAAGRPATLSRGLQASLADGSCASLTPGVLGAGWWDATVRLPDGSAQRACLRGNRFGLCVGAARGGADGTQAAAAAWLALLTLLLQQRSAPHVVLLPVGQPTRAAFAAAATACPDSASTRSGWWRVPGELPMPGWPEKVLAGDLLLTAEGALAALQAALADSGFAAGDCEQWEDNIAAAAIVPGEEAVEAGCAPVVDDLAALVADAATATLSRGPHSLPEQLTASLSQYCSSFVASADSFGVSLQMGYHSADWGVRPPRQSLSRIADAAQRAVHAVMSSECSEQHVVEAYAFLHRRSRMLDGESESGKSKLSPLAVMERQTQATVTEQLLAACTEEDLMLDAWPQYFRPIIPLGYPEPTHGKLLLVAGQPLGFVAATVVGDSLNVVYAFMHPYVRGLKLTRRLVLSLMDETACTRMLLPVSREEALSIAGWHDTRMKHAMPLVLRDLGHSLDVHCAALRSLLSTSAFLYSWFGS
eukprot:PLAT8202.1.p1 GENE.PLAT8202.1~~PLAT8202.1.p1  ORF type:complete len:1162 (-),score=563.50 PLAT8202.1:357-3842(-)